MEKSKGYIQLYTGNGKGKTTAAIGAAIRAAGAGKTVFIAQFVKGMPYSELNSLKLIPQIHLQQFGLDCFIKNKPVQKDIDAAQKGLEAITRAIKSNSYSMIIMDEICIALHYKLLPIKTVVQLLNEKPGEMEIILTGRYATKELIKSADLVTEMKEVKHYYNKGIQARKGIEF
ncbi:MAG: cob(I)yrinic acid a,c-diamide adenosyltransferase [Bacteroidales bacterium]